MISSALHAPAQSGSETKWTPSYTVPVARPWQPLAVLPFSVLVLTAAVRMLHWTEGLTYEIGMFLLFGAACIADWVWAYRLFGGFAAVCATALYTGLPVVLAPGSPAAGNLLGRTPIPFVVLGVIGSLLILRRATRSGWTALIPVACAAAFLAIETIWNGVVDLRYVLPMFAVLSIPAGYGLAWLLRSPRVSLLICGTGLLVGEVWSSIRG